MQIPPVNYQFDQLEKKHRHMTFHLFHGYVRLVLIWMSIKAIHSVFVDICGCLCVRCVRAFLANGNKKSTFIGLGWEESLGNLRPPNLSFFEYHCSLLGSHMVFLHLHYLLLLPDCMLHKVRRRHHDAAQQKRKQE